MGALHGLQYEQEGDDASAVLPHMLLPELRRESVELPSVLCRSSQCNPHRHSRPLDMEPDQGNREVVSGSESETGSETGSGNLTPHPQHEALFCCGYQSYTLKMDDCEDGREIVEMLSPFPKTRSKCAKYIKFAKWTSEAPDRAVAQVRYDKGHCFERRLRKLHPNIRIVHVDYTY
jgi:hypothetical protein